LKIFFIVLIVLIIAFVAIEVVGVGKNSSETAADYKGGGDPVINCPGNKYQIFCSMNSMLDRFSPKLQLKQKTFTVTKTTQTLSVTVPADDKNSFRNATFKFNQGNNCATVEYISPATCSNSPPSCNSDLSKLSNDCRLKYQTWPTCKDGVKGKLIVVKSGGTLDIKLTGQAPCTVALQ